MSDIVERAKEWISDPPMVKASLLVKPIIEELIAEIERLRSLNEILDNLADINLKEPEIKIEGKQVKVHVFKALNRKIESLTKELESVKNHVGEIETIQGLKKTIEGQAKRVGDLLRLQKEHSKEIKSLKAQLAESEKKLEAIKND